MARGFTEEDPFAIFHVPPPNETPQERVARETKETEAKKVSDQIDEQLKVDRASLKKQKNIVRVLLLGQAESGEHPPFLLFFSSSCLSLDIIEYRQIYNTQK